MASLTLVQLLDQALKPEDFGSVSHRLLHRLLSDILGYLGMEDLPTQEVGRSQTPLPGGTWAAQALPASEEWEKDQERKGQEMLEELKADGSKVVALSPQSLPQKFSAAMEELTRVRGELEMLKEAVGLGKLQDAASQLPSFQDRGTLESPREGSGAQSASAEPITMASDTQHEATREITSPGIQTGSLSTQTISTGTEPGSPSTQDTMLGTEPGSPSTQGITPGAEPGSPSTQDITSGTKPGSPSTQAAFPGTEPGSPSTQGITPGTQPGSPSTQGITPGTQPGTEPGSPSTQGITPGTQPGSPSTQGITPGTQPGSPRTQDITSGTQPGSPSTQGITPGTQPGSPSTQGITPGTEPGSPSTQAAFPGTQPGSPSTQAAFPGTQPGSPSTQAAFPGTQPGSPSTQAAFPGMQLPPPESHREGAGIQQSSPHMDLGLSGSEKDTRGALGTQGSLSQVEQLSHLYAALKEQVAQLEATKVDKDELRKLSLLLFPEGDQENIIPNMLGSLWGQVSSLDSILQDQKEKVGELEDGLGKLGAAQAEQGENISDQITQQVRSMQQEMSLELREQLEESRARLERLQQELEKVRESVRSAEQEAAGAWAGPGVSVEEQAVCRFCGSDIDGTPGQPESLQELVGTSMLRQTVMVAGRNQQGEKELKKMQVSIAQLQKECEELWGILRDEREQRHQNLEALSCSVERLQKEKADKEDLEEAMDMKANRSALAGIVSHSQLEAILERLEQRIQEMMLSQVASQKQDYIQSQEKLLEQMESKVDCQELGSLQKQLEERCKSILEQGKGKLLPEGNDAAGVKSPLLAQLSCLSCDRPLSMRVPGPYQEALPYLPPLSPHLAMQQESNPRLEHGHRELAAKCKYPRVPRDCGGQHTLTPKQQHPLRLQPLLPSDLQLLQPPRKDEMELLGQDGAMDRAQQDGCLPTLPPVWPPRTQGSNGNQQQ
ncbi:glutamine-rich protein 2-like isoform X2 [Heliangelus exortis]|uniref:glutamine-rich protein 2-like isoform X2 n=1 Tax=Heliangelus exortis TaxID=472823 RepID=UPI003A93D418